MLCILITFDGGNQKLEILGISGRQKNGKTNLERGKRKNYGGGDMGLT